MITTRTGDIPLSMEEDGTSYFYSVRLSIHRGICYGAAYGSILLLVGLVAIFDLPMLLIEFFENHFRKHNRASLVR